MSIDAGSAKSHTRLGPVTLCLVFDAYADIPSHPALFRRHAAWRRAWRNYTLERLHVRQYIVGGLGGAAF